MRLIGMMPVRNEGWVLDLSARAALKWCDGLVILNHASRDATGLILFELIEEFGDRIKVLDVAGDWTEMQHRQTMLVEARKFGATHLAIVDADEVLTGNLLGCIRTHIEAMPAGWIMQLPGYNLRGSLDRFHANGIWGHRWFSVAFANDPRLNWAGDRFHQREPNGASLRLLHPIMQGHGGIMHLWGASERRLVAKHALYKMTEARLWPEKSKFEIDHMYNLAIYPSASRGYEQNWRFADVPADWWAPYADLKAKVLLDDVPWQEAECKSLEVQYGPERFAGLDLFGVNALVEAGAR